MARLVLSLQNALLARLVLARKNLSRCITTDDTNLFFKSKDLNSHVNVINSKLELVKNWSNRNKLTLNLSKTSYIALKTHQNQSSLKSKSIKIGSTYLNEENSIKFLGVEIDKHLCWNLHIQKLCTKLRPMLGMLFKCSGFLPRKVLLLIYNSFINSEMSYCLSSGETRVKHIWTKFICYRND